MRNFNRIGGGAAAAVLAGALALGGVSSASAAGIGGVTNCSAPGGKQEVGAALGAVLGGVIGNKVGGRHATGETVVGAVAGAAAGSAVGCQMQKSRQATASGYGAPTTYTRNGYRLSSDIAPASYSRIGESFVATSSVNLRAGPTTRSGRVGSLRAGERFEALAAVRGSDWILVGQDGVGVGYVNSRYARPSGYRQAAY